MQKIRHIALLGSTGSIGTQTLDTISKFPERFRVEALTAGSNAGLLVEQARKHKPSVVVIADVSKYKEVKEILGSMNINVLAGNEGLEHVVTLPEIDFVIAAMVGYAGMKPVMSAVKAGKDVALANKETLVVAGELIIKNASASGSRIIPVDSEHSAIFQCLAGENRSAIDKIVLTASGGPFLDYPYERLLHVTPAEAMKHPKWDMGSKVTIDSASLMNKGLEVIEARWLFNVMPEQIEVVIHPQSIIHSLVFFCDGSVKAQMGIPDMRIPILYALGYPERLPSDLPRLDLHQCGDMTFKKPDQKIFKNLPLAFEALRAGGNKPCILNAANEIAVNGFLEGRAGFLQMADIVEHAMNRTTFVRDISLEVLENSDLESRTRAKEYLNKIY